MSSDSKFAFPIDHTQRKVSECLGLSDAEEEAIRNTIMVMVGDEQEKGISGVIEMILGTFEKPNEITFALYIFGRWSAHSECPLHNAEYSELAKMLKESLGEDGPDIQIIGL